VNGLIQESFVKENLSVKRGDTLFMIESVAQSEKHKFLLDRSENIEEFTTDLHSLISQTNLNKLATSLYIQSDINYRQKLGDVTIRLSKVQLDYQRNLRLYHEKVIAEAEFENSQFELDKAKNDFEMTRQNQFSQWRNELHNFERELQELKSQLAQLEIERENLIIKAPVSGTLQNLKGVYVGSMIFANH
jgi:HlyD family secretion protein